VGGASRLPRSTKSLLSSNVSSEPLLSCTDCPVLLLSCTGLGSGIEPPGFMSADVGCLGTDITVDVEPSSSSFDEAALDEYAAGLRGGATICVAAPVDMRPRDEGARAHQRPRFGNAWDSEYGRATRGSVLRLALSRVLSRALSRVLSRVLSPVLSWVLSRVLPRVGVLSLPEKRVGQRCANARQDCE